MKKVFKVGCFGIIILIIAYMVGASMFDNQQKKDLTQKGVYHKFKIEVTGEGVKYANINYTLLEKSQSVDIKLPFVYEEELVPGSVYSVLVSSKGKAGVIKTSIYYQGELINSSSGSGDFPACSVTGFTK